MIKKSHRCATTLRLCLLSLTLIFSAAAVSQDDNISVEDAYDRIRDLGKRGSELFAIATPGETYNEISGSIGHSAIDMTL